MNHQPSSILSLAENAQSPLLTGMASLPELDHAARLPLSPQPSVLAVIVPTYNERENIPELISRLEAVLQGLSWEVWFVDDQSPDKTAELITTYAQCDPRIRLLERIDRRGLSSACVEGILATAAPYVALMDADMQHDEAIVPQMLAKLMSEQLDVVVGTRNAGGGSMGEFCSSRRLLSRLGRRVSQAVCQCPISDPMSGFFLLDRAFFLNVCDKLHGVGFKILVDILSSAERPVRLGEVGYTFRLRRHGESKLNVNIGIEYLLLILHKLAAYAVPSRIARFFQSRIRRRGAAAREWEFAPRLQPPVTLPVHPRR